MNIILYTKRGCPWCDAVRSFLKINNLPFEEREVLSSKEYFDEMVAKSGQQKAPTLDIDGHILADSDEEQVKAYLEEKGVLSKK